MANYCIFYELPNSAESTGFDSPYGFFAPISRSHTPLQLSVAPPPQAFYHTLRHCPVVSTLTNLPTAANT